jgi:hypothetical protein
VQFESIVLYRANTSRSYFAEIKSTFRGSNSGSIRSGEDGECENGQEPRRENGPVQFVVPPPPFRGGLPPPARHLLHPSCCSHPSISPSPSSSRLLKPCPPRPHHPNCHRHRPQYLCCYRTMTTSGPRWSSRGLLSISGEEGLTDCGQLRRSDS